MKKTLQVSYRKSMEHHYLVLSGKTEEREDYQLQMVLENRIPGLLPMEVKLREGKKELYYDVSSLQPLGRIYERKELRGEEIRKVLVGILDILGGLRDYLLDENGVVLDPQYIFTEMESGAVRLLFCPATEEGTEKEEDPMLQLAEFLMEHADHRDPQAALFAYRIYQTVRKGNYVMADLRRILEENAGTMDGRTERIPQVTEEATEDFTDPLYEAEKEPRSRKKPKEPGKTTERSGEEPDKTGHAPLILAVVLVLAGALFCSGNIPGVYPDKAGKLAAVAMMAAGVAVFVLQQIRGKRAGQASPATVEKEAPDLEDIFADLDPVKKEEVSGRFAGQDSEAEDYLDPRDAAEEEYGRTVFTGDLDVPAGNILLEVAKKKEYRIDHFPFTIGKMKDCVDLALTDRSVSRIHARILQKNGKAYLQDCHSTNGTYINGVQLEAEETVMLEKDDEIEIGKVKLRYI